MSIKATGQLTIKAIADLTYEDICTHDTTTGLIECTHAQDQGCVRITEIQGKSEQVQSTQGKNLCPSNFTEWEMGHYGMEDGIKAPYPPRICLKKLLRVTPSSNLYLNTNSSKYSFLLRSFNASGEFVRNVGTITNANNITLNATEYYLGVIILLPGDTATFSEYQTAFSNGEIKPFICINSVVDKSYEPFTPNSPSPDYPSVINSVGDSGKLNVVSSVGRRNLLLDSGRVITTTAAYNVVIYRASSLKPNTKYTFVINGFTNSGNSLGVWFNHGNSNGKMFSATTTAKTQYIVVTTPSALYTEQVYIFNYPQATATNATINWACMYEGEIKPPLDWIPAPEDITPENAKQYEDKLSLATVNLASPLRSAPNGIHDVLECKDGVWGVTRNLAERILNGSETWAEYPSIDSRPSNSYCYSWQLPNFVLGYNTSICSHFKNVSVAWGYGNIGQYSDHTTVTRKYFITDIANLNNLKLWLSLNQPTVLYTLATPTWEPLDDPSQKALNNLLSYSDKDYIYTTDPLGTNFSVAVKSRAFYENFKLQQEIKNTNSSLGDLDDEIKGGFYDGIINVNEAEAIRKAAETMHTQVTNQFNKVDSNPSLTGAPKTTHQTKYTECNNAYNTLIYKINTAIDYCSVNSTKTDAQKKTAVTDMNTAFGTYKTKLADYQKAYQDAIDAIAKKKAEDAVDGVVIGGRNLFRQSGHWEKLPDTKYWGNNGGTLSLDTTIKYLGYNTLRTTVGSGINGHNAEWLELDTNKIYTYSAMILTNANVTGNHYTPLRYHCSNDKVEASYDVDTIKYQQVAISNKWTLLYLTFKPNRKYWRPFVYIGSGSTIFNIAYLKLEEGTKATDWTPNSEDTDEKITQVSATLTSTINDVQRTVDKNTKSITDKVWKSDIITGIKDLNVGGINLWDLSAIKRYASGGLNTIVAGTAVDAKTGKITVTANPQDIIGCKVDVSLLTRNTSNAGELVITGYFDRPDTDSTKLQGLKLYYKCFNASNAEVQASTGKDLPVETSSNLFAGTLSIPANTAYIHLGIGQHPYVKPYTLTGITVKDSALYDITKGLRDQISKAYQDINGFKQTVSDTYTTKTEFDQFQVSAKNLARGNTGELRGYTPTTGTNSTYNYAKVYTAGLKAGDTVTVAIDVEYTNRGSASGQTHSIWFQGAAQPGDLWTIYNPFTACITNWGMDGTSGNVHLVGKAVIAAGHLKYDHFNFGVRSDYSNGTATYRFKNLMVVRGEKEMDWTPAPEDTDEKFTNYTTTTDMNSKIDQTKSDIELGVSRTYTSKAEGDKITQGLNKWILEVYQLTSSSMPNPRVADIEHIRGKVPTKIIEVADTAMSATLNAGDYYIGHAFTYLYFDAAYTWSGTIKTDDEGVIYLNGVKKVSTATSVATNISLPFQAGWNVLEVVYNEATGNDGWVFGSQLSKLTQCKIMNCYAQVSLNASALIKVTADAINSKVENNSAYSEVVQNAGKIKWLVASGKDPASMELTPEALNVVAKYINLNGNVKVNGNMLVDGAITATKIAAKAITADKIAIGDFTNYAQLNVDTLSKWGFTSVDDPSASANPWYKRNNITRDNFISEWYPCNGGESFRIKADIKTTVKSSSTNGGTDSDFKGVTVGVYCYSNTNAASTYYAQRVTNQTQSISSVVTLNSAVRKFAVFVQIEGWAPFTGELFVRNVQVTKMSTGELIVDGSVTADKMNVKGLTVSDGSKNTLAIDNAGNVSLDVKSLRITGSAAATQSEAQGYASSAKSEAISAAASDATTKANNAKTDAVNAAKSYTDNGLGSKLDTSWLTQKNIFDKLTNNGALEGIYMEGGKLYINAEYIQSGTISAHRINGGQLSGVSLDIGAGNFKVSDIGDVRATRGTIAGWNLTYDCFWKGSSTLGATGKTNIYLGDKGISFSDKFIYSTSTGELEINGKILASSGYIGDKVSGFTIGSKAIYNGMSTLGSAATGIYLGTDGISLGGGKFKVDKDGITTATSGIIGGWNITPDSMNRQFTANNKNYWLYFDTGTTSDAFAAFMLRTKATTASAWEDKFSIAWNGKMTAMDADVRGKITATTLTANTSGSIAGINFDSKKMYITATDVWGKVYNKFLIDPTGENMFFVAGGVNGTSTFCIDKNGATTVTDLRLTTGITPIGANVRIFSPLDVDGIIYENNMPLNTRYQAKGSYSASNHTHTAAQVGAAATSHEHGKLYQDGTAVATTSNGGLAFRPDAARGTGKVTLGTGNYRWSVVYATNGTINVSDRNDKTNFQPIDERYEKMFMDLSPELFQWKNFTSKDHHDRLHCGLIAQNLEEALHKNNLSAETFAALCKDNLETPTPDGRLWQYGVNYGELHGLEIHMIQKTIHQVNAQEQTMQELKEENIVLRNNNRELTGRLNKLEKIVEAL